MNTHPTATLHMANGSKIVIELLTKFAFSFSLNEVRILSLAIKMKFV